MCHCIWTPCSDWLTGLPKRKSTAEQYSFLKPSLKFPHKLPLLLSFEHRHPAVRHYQHLSSSHLATFNSYLLFSRKIFSSSIPRNHCQARHFSPGEILMSLQGPSRSNYVEQLLSLTGPQLPEENTNVPGKQNSPTFDKTLDTRGYK